MLAKFQIINPEATINLITNPSIEGNVIYFPIPPFGAGSVVGWEAVGSTLAVVIEPARFGAASLEVQTNGVVPFEGTYFRVDPGTRETFYAGSVYVRGEGAVRARLVDSTGDEFMSDAVQLSPDRWQRITDVIGQTGGAISNDLRLYIETTGIQATTFYVDGAQIEQKTHSTTYCDGTQDGCTWNVIEHASTSDRSSQERSGGQLIDLDDESVGIYVTVAGGIGTPPLRHNLQGRALLPGMEFQSTKILPRVIQLTFWAKNPGGRQNDLRPLHQKRQMLIDLIKPDIVSPTQPFMLRYNGGRVPIDIECYYEAGLEFDGDVRNALFNSFVMRMICTDPFWAEDNQEAIELELQENLGLLDGILQRVDGEWQDWGGTLAGIAANAKAIAVSPDGRVYMGGGYSTVGGVAYNFVAYWDGENWNPLNAAVFGPGLDGFVFAIAIDYNGLVYLGGNFTDVFGGPGNTYSNIVTWDPVTETFAALGTGLNGQVNAIAIAPNGHVYVGGAFDDVVAGVGNTLNQIARWDPVTLSFRTVGAGPGFLGGDVESIMISGDGQTVYIGGEFTSEWGGVPGEVDYIASYNVDTDTISELGNGAGNSVYGLELARNGDLYIGGSFVAIGGVSAHYAAVWNGSAYSALGVGLDARADKVNITSDGLVWYGGIFTQAGGRVVDGGFAAWNRSVWIIPPVNLPQDSIGADPDVWDVKDHEGNLYIAGDFNGTINAENTLVAAITEVDNIGASDTQPIVEIRGPGILSWLENVTTGEIIYLDYTIQVGEILTIDFRTGKKTITSSWLGNILDAALPHSNIATFHLQPGINRISLFVDDITLDSSAQIRYVPQYESADGTVR